MSLKYLLSAVAALIVINIIIYSCSTAPAAEKTTTNQGNETTVPATTSQATEMMADNATVPAAITEPENNIATSNNNAAQPEPTATHATTNGKSNVKSSANITENGSAADLTSKTPPTKSASANNTATTPIARSNGAKMVFEHESWDFGFVYIGDKVNHEYVFTNTGSEPLIIRNATSTCGCTIPEYPNAPILPGQKAAIKVSFDSTNKVGVQSKNIELDTNIGKKVISLNGVVTTFKKDDKKASGGTPKFPTPEANATNEIPLKSSGN